MDFATGCCPDSIDPYSCDTCTELDGCCSSYEHCVSCCMAPKHVPKERMTETYIGLFKYVSYRVYVCVWMHAVGLLPYIYIYIYMDDASLVVILLCRADTGHWSNEFDYCKSACRTTSRSTQNENEYIGYRKYCYSEERRPRDSEPVAFQDGRFVAKGAEGVSCEDACKAHNAVCADEETSPVNTCDDLRSAFMCEAGCTPIPQLGESASDTLYPGYVGVKAPKADRPGTCFIQDSSSPERKLVEDVTRPCDAQSKFVHRLCICRRDNPHSR